MSESQGSWKGKPIEEYSKQELINIIVSQANEISFTRIRHKRDLEIVSNPGRIYIMPGRSL